MTGSWKTTVCGIVAAVGGVLQTDTGLPPWALTLGKCLVAIGVGGVGIFARDNNVSSEALGIPTSQPPATARHSDATLTHPMTALAGLILPLALLAGTGCAYVTTKTVRERQLPPSVVLGLVGTNHLTAEQERMFIVKETAKTRAVAFFEAKQALEAAQAKQTATTQTSGFTGLEQTATSSNLTAIIEAVVKAAISAAAKSAVP